MMRRNVTFAITLEVKALATIGVTRLAYAQSIFLPSLSATSNNAIDAASDDVPSEQPLSIEITPPAPRPPLEITDLVPDLPDEQKTQVVFEDDDGNQTSFYVAYRDHDAVNELIIQYGTLIAILEPANRLYPDGNAPTELAEDYVSDPNFVHPDPVMPPALPTPMQYPIDPELFAAPPTSR